MILRDISQGISPPERMRVPEPEPEPVPLLRLAVGDATALFGGLSSALPRLRVAERWLAVLTFVGSYLDRVRR